MSSINERVAAFKAPGVRIEGAPSRLMLAASLLLVGLVALSPTPGRSAETAVVDRVVASIQSDIDFELGNDKVIIARSAPDVAASFPIESDADLTVFVDGNAPNLSTEDYFRGPAGVYDTGEVTDADLARFEIYRQVGAAFAERELDKDERTAFAAFASLRDGAPIELLELLAAKSELDQLTGVDNPISAHILHRVLQASNEQVLPTLTRFTLDEIRQMSDMFDNDTRRDPIDPAFGEALGKALSASTFYIPVQDGVVAGNADAWLRSASSVPEIARVVELRSFLYDRHSTGQELTRFHRDPDKSAAELERLAQAGDGVARDLAPLFGVETSYRYVPVSDLGLLSSDEVGGVAIRFDRSNLLLHTAPDGGALFANTRDHALVFVANAEGMKHTFYEQAGHDATLVDGQPKP